MKKLNNRLFKIAKILLWKILRKNHNFIKLILMNAIINKNSLLYNKHNNIKKNNKLFSLNDKIHNNKNN